MGNPLITGIDIGHHSIKAVVLKAVGGTFVLAGYKELLVETEIFSDNHTFNYQEIVKKLKELRKGLPLFSRKVAICVPDGAVISKILQIDAALESREQEFAILQAFSQQSPFPVEELNIDYQKVETKGANTGATSTYQVYATKKEVVESRLIAVKKAGFTPILMDVQVHCLVNLWQLAANAQSRRNWLLVDVGYTQSAMCMDFANAAPFSKELPIGTRMCESEDVELQPQKTDQFISLFIDRLQRQMQLYSSVHSDFPIKGIWLTGGGAHTPILVDEIQRRLQIDCETLNPFSLLEHKRFRKQPRQMENVHYTTAVGLALRGINWLEREHVA